MNVASKNSHVTLLASVVAAVALFAWYQQAAGAVSATTAPTLAASDLQCAPEASSTQAEKVYFVGCGGFF